MENRNLEDGRNFKKMANAHSISSSIPQTNKGKVKKKSWKINFQTKSNASIHSDRKVKQIECKKCKLENKSKLKPCNICKEYMCKECIKADSVTKITKKLRNPMLYICKSCLVEHKTRRGKLNPPVDNRIGNNSVECEDRYFDDINRVIDRNRLSPSMNVHKLVPKKGICESCNCFKDNILIMNSFFELMKSVTNIYKVNGNQTFLSNTQLFWNYYQMINPIINSYLDFPLQLNLTLCEDCFKEYMKYIDNHKENIFFENKFERMETINNNEKGVLSQIKSFVNQFSQECRSYHLMFDSILKKLLNTSIQRNIHETEINEDNSEDNTLALDYFNKRSILLVQQLKGTIENLTQLSSMDNQTEQYSVLNYQPNLQQHSFFVQNQLKPFPFPIFNTFQPMNKSDNQSMDFQFNLP